MSGSRRPSTDIASERQQQVIDAVERTIQHGESCGSQRLQNKDYRIKMMSKTKTYMYQVNMLKKYIAREPEVDVQHTSNKDDATIAVAGS